MADLCTSKSQEISISTTGWVDFSVFYLALEFKILKNCKFSLGFVQLDLIFLP